MNYCILCNDLGPPAAWVRFYGVGCVCQVCGRKPSEAALREAALPEPEPILGRLPDPPS